MAEDEYLKDFTDLSEAQDRGILKKVIREGNSDLMPCKGDVVVVHYVGTYYGGEQHGKEFDSSRARNEQFEFTLGKGDVIKAWDVAVATMKMGEICELIATPEYAYMDEKTLKFEIELFESKGMDVSATKDGSVRKSIIKEGVGISNPAAGMRADISIARFIDGEFGKPKDLSYFVGDLTSDMPEGIDRAVRNMKAEEVCRVKISRPKAVIDTSSSGDIVPGSEDIYELHLRSFEKVKHLSSITGFTEQMEYANSIKDKANDYLKAKKYSVALEMYNRLDEDLQYILANGTNEQKRLNSVIVAIRLNIALAHLKMNDATKCEELCRKVLEIDAGNEKALFRLGQACLLKKDHEEAIVYFKRVLFSHPGNAEAMQQLRMCENVIQKVKDQEKKIYRTVFERMKHTGLGDADNPHAVETVNNDTDAKSAL